MKLMESVSLWKRLKETDKPIVLYGMGDGADKILDEMGRRSIAAAGVFASDEFCRGQKFRGFSVTTYAQKAEEFDDFIVLVAFGTQIPSVLERIQRIATERELYAPDVPVIGEGIFDKAYFEKHEAEITSAYKMLADEWSRRVFEHMINYKISGKPDYLFGCESDAREAFQDILNLSDEETYVDVGAYTGDTMQELIEYTGGYRKIFAVEPDKKNFAKLIKYAQGMRDVYCFHAAAHEEAGTMCFAARGGRNSAVGNGETIRKETLDVLLKGERVTYIKYDVEGEERSALLGTKRILREQKPKLLVSAYHRNADLFSIPLLVKEIQPDYRVFLRHYPYIPAWDTNYYFV